MPQDLESSEGKLEPIAELARGLGLRDEELELYGRYKAKVSPDALARLADRPNGRYVLVTSLTPTPLGEGKTTVSIGLAMAMNRLGYRTTVCLREASLGPVFGLKGGAAGGGRAQLAPFEDVNLHLTGDNHAVAAAHNLLAAFIDNSLFHGNPCEIDPFSITWPRALDMNDRALRRIVIGLGGKGNGPPREASFDSVGASEVMAILSLLNGQDRLEVLRDLRARLGRIIVGSRKNGEPLTAEELKAAGAMTVVLKEAVKPNLVQTLEKTPAFVHTGPFANVAHGGNSILADRIALKLSDYVITEAGFGSDLGMEKFIDIKCRVSGVVPDAVVLVATVRACKMHGGLSGIAPGQPLPPELLRENMKALEKGVANLVKHIENARIFGLAAVVAINHFPTDTDREIRFVEQVARDAGAEGAFLCEVYERGGAGAISLAESVAQACRRSKYKPLYHDELPIKAKIERIVAAMYGGDGVDFAPRAERKLARLTELGQARLPICMVKSHLSLSHDQELKGRPRGFRVPVRDVALAAGAGFIDVFCGEPRGMPGLPAIPAGMGVDIDERGNTLGLF